MILGDRIQGRVQSGDGGDVDEEGWDGIEMLQWWFGALFGRAGRDNQQPSVVDHSNDDYKTHIELGPHDL